MTANEELNKALYDKMSAEMERYRKELLSMPPDEILKNAYEYAVREDILLTMENYDLDDERARALLDSETPLADAFQAVEGENIGYTDMIQRCVWKKANSLLWEKRMAAQPESERPQETPPPKKKSRSGKKKNPAR